LTLEAKARTKDYEFVLKDNQGRRTKANGQHHCLYQTVLLTIRTELPSRVAGAEVNVSVSNAHQFRRQRASKVRVSPPCHVPPQRSASNPYHSSRRIRIVSTEGTIETREASHYRSGVIERQARVSNAHQFRRQRARSVTDRVSAPCPLCPAACPLPLDVLLRIGAATIGQHHVSYALRTMLSCKGGYVTSAGWQVTLCGPTWHVSSRSGVAEGQLRTAIPVYFYFTLNSSVYCTNVYATNIAEISA